MNEPEGRPRRFGGCAEIAATMQDSHGHMVKAVGDMSRLLEALTPRIIQVRTYVLGADGGATDSVHVPYRAMAVDHIKVGAATTPVYVANETYQGASSMPTQGPGIAVCRNNGFTVVNLKGYAFSVWNGSAGDLVTVTLFGTPQPPNSGT